jgi:hypothetical protein
MNRRDKMEHLLGRRERLGLTFKALARESGVPAGTLAFWAWKLRHEALARQQASPSPAGFVELVARPKEPCVAEGRVEIVLVGGRRVVVPVDIDESQLARLVSALERC